MSLTDRIGPETIRHPLFVCGVPDAKLHKRVVHVPEQPEQSPVLIGRNVKCFGDIEFIPGRLTPDSDLDFDPVYPLHDPLENGVRPPPF